MIRSWRAVIEHAAQIAPQEVAGLVDAVQAGIHQPHQVDRREALGVDVGDRRVIRKIPERLNAGDQIAVARMAHQEARNR